MNRLNSILILVLLSITSCAQSNEWSGTYVYEADLGKNVADDAVIVEYTLKVTDKCSLTIVGYQVNESIMCLVKAKDDSAEILFKSYDNGSLKNIYDVEIYNTQQPLFVLKKTNKGVMTAWGQLKPDESKQVSGDYFNKQK